MVFLSSKFSHVSSLRSNHFGLTGFEPNFEKYFLMHKLNSLKQKESARRSAQQYVLLKDHNKIVFFPFDFSSKQPRHETSLR